MAHSFWHYFKLLLWKNFLIKFRHKKALVLEIIIPLLFCGLLLLIRNVTVSIRFDSPTKFPPVEINNLNHIRHLYMRWEIAYAPDNESFDKLLTDAVSGFQLSKKGFKNAQDLEAYMLTNSTFCGVIFDTGDSKSIKELPTKFAYRLRFPAILREGFKDKWWTGSLYPEKLEQGPRNNASSDGGAPPGYIREGFIAVQNAISKSFIKMSAKNVGKNGVNIPEIVMERFPYPPYTYDSMLVVLQFLVAIIFLSSFSYPVNQTVKYITSEKENQLKETMKIMGLTTAHHWTAWFFTIFICMAIIVLAIVCLLKIPIVQGRAVLMYSSWSLLFVFLLFYSMAMITFCFMVSSFFSKASVAGSLAGVIWFLFYIPYSFTISDFIQMGALSKLAFSLFLNTAMPFGFKSILSWEVVSIGAQWRNLFNRSNLEGYLSIGEVMIMLLVDALLYMLITLYVEKVMPGSFGVPEKWYFPFSKEFWYPKKYDYFEDYNGKMSELDHERFELDPSYVNREVGVRLRNLTKLFDGKIAVNDLSLDMYEDDITVLLGHNGAGKTTTISMITGFLAASKGTVIINGIDISKNIARVRKNLGICPQHNILFDDLTVAEHIIFYSRLKGLTEGQIDSEITKYLGILNLEDKRNALAKTLSGGMKRKLSLGVALCGDSKVVLCDEPSSGMDPQARRAVWDLLESEKKGRTILLTTHYMDEADVLADRIAIMSHGKLTCCGTSFFLKKKFGTGYQLICNKGPGCRKDKVTALLRKYIPDVEVKTDVGTELSYRLPESYAAIFEALLKDLEDSQAELQLNGYGISMTTLEDVFMRTGSELHEVSSEKEELNDNHSGVLIHPTNSQEIVDDAKRSCYQWRAMFLKKYYYSIRNWYLFLLQLLMPVLLVVICLNNSESVASTNNLPALRITLDSYGYTTTLLSSPKTLSNSTIAQSYHDMFKNMPGSHHVVSTEKDMQEEISALGNKPLQFSEGTNYMVAATIQSNQAIAWFNNEAYHTAPLALNLIQNAIAKAVLGSDFSISVTNEPLPFDADYKMQQVKSGSDIGFQLALNIGFVMAFASAIFILYIVKERESRAKLLQFVSGVRTVIFWSVHLLFDLITYIAIGICLVLITFIFNQKGFQTADELGRIFLIFVLYGFASLPFTYLAAFLFSNASTGLSRLSILNILAGPVIFIIVYVIKQFDGENMKVKIAEGIFLLFPNFALSDALAGHSSVASWTDICETMCKTSNMTMDEICSFGIMSKCCNLSPYAWNSPGIGMILVYMCATGAVYFILLLIIEHFYRRLRNVNNMFGPALPASSVDVDDDVQREKQRVSSMSYQDIANQTLVMRGLTKYYKKLLAVNQLSLAIEHGECFGLLGVNGAGKTSAFKMLTGDEHISYGDIWIEGYNTKKDLPKIYEMIGYCPQFDALLLDLTGRETLRIFSLIRGIPIHTIDALTTRLGQDLAFERYLNKKVSEYSGGNRRKLSTAVALLGNPEIVYLDEPTSGIDPASRRKLWDMICYVRDLGKGIVLTSHSMEECEALCTRIAIMVNGEFKCLGSTQHLKDKFSKGISLTVKLKKVENEGRLSSMEASAHFTLLSSEDVNMDKYERGAYEFIMKKFPGAVLKDSRPRLLTFDIPLNIMPYSRIFGLMEGNKNILKIEDYSLTQATLEQVFLKFAQQQRVNDKTDKKNKKD